MKAPRLRKNHIVWADYDPHAGRAQRWAYYTTKAEQRSNRPDLDPIRLKVVRVERVR